MSLPLYGLIFRARGQQYFGAKAGFTFWSLFTSLLLHYRGHTPNVEWFGIDLLVIAVLFWFGSMPGWSKDCWPAWQSSDPVVRDKATRASIVRGLWYIPLFAYVGWRGGHLWAIAPLEVAMVFGFALCMRWNDSIRVWLKLPNSAIWCFGEIMIGMWLGLITHIMVA